MLPKTKTHDPLDSWATNRIFYEGLNTRFNFDPFDPCPMDCNLEQFNGLTAEWEGDRIFVNPPYSQKDKESFIRRGFLESQQGKLIVLLIPASTSTKIFHEVIQPHAKIEFVKGRIAFEGIDRSGNWVNAYQGLHRPRSVTSETPQIKRGGLFDSLVVIFGDK